MASFSISNFIAAHAGTDVAIRIKDINGNFRYGFNVGRIQKVATEDKKKSVMTAEFLKILERLDV